MNRSSDASVYAPVNGPVDAPVNAPSFPRNPRPGPAEPDRAIAGHGAQVDGLDRAPRGGPPSPGMALSIHRLPWPTPWTELFGRDGPLCVEIGFGRGAFLLDLARRRPEANVIGIEISNRSLVAVERAAALQGLHNVRAVHATGQAALAHLFAPGTVGEVHVNFPDPWFKTRHAHRRLLAPMTIARIASCLEIGGTLHCATDVAAYAVEIDRALAGEPALANALAADQRASPTRLDGAVTKYESLAIAAGRPCAYFKYARTATAAAPTPVLTELPMPHVALRSTGADPSAAATTFTSRQVRVAGCHVHPLAAYVGPTGLLIDTVVVDPTIEQHIAVAVHPRADGAWVVGLATIGQPRPTLGCHVAVAVVARWLLAVLPGAEVVAEALSLDPVARAMLAEGSAAPVDGVAAADAEVAS